MLTLIIVAVIVVLIIGIYPATTWKSRIKIYVARGGDDGVVYILRDYGPIAGYIWGGGEGMLVGGAKGGGHQTTSRGLMRFNISD